jgi:hypothetical protein
MSTGGEIHAGSVITEFEFRTEKSRAQLEEARRKVQEAKAALEDLNRTAAGGKDFDRAYQGLSTSLSRATSEVRELEAAIAKQGMAMDSGAAMTTKVHTGMKGISDGSSMASYRLMALGNTMDDLQYVGSMGIRPIVNNVMQISPAIGIALIAVDQLSKHWSQLAEAVLGTPVVDEVQKMHDLADATDETAAATDRLAKAKKQAKDIAALQEARTEEQQRTAKEVTEAVTEYGTDKESGIDRIAGSLVAAQRAGGELPTSSPEVEKARRDAEYMRSVGSRNPFNRDMYRTAGDRAKVADKMVKDAEDKFNNEQLRQARELVEAARTDPLKRKQLAGAVRQFDPGLAGQIEAAGTPEGKPSAYQQDQSRLAQKQTDDSREGLAEEREKRLKERNEQVKAERKEREKQVEEYSKDLQGAIGRDIIGNVTGGAGAMDPDRLRGRETRKIRDRLRQSGVADEDAEDLAPDVYDKVFKATVAQIKKKAMGDPAGKMDDLGAARALRDEDAEKARREKEQRAGRLQKDAAELLPGLDALSRSEIGRRIGAGQSDEAAQAGAAKAIEAALVKAGMKPGDARARSRRASGPRTPSSSR